MKKQYLFFAIVLVLISVVSFFFKQAALLPVERERPDSYSTFETSPRGEKAFYLILSRLGFNVNRWRSSYKYLDKKVGCLLVNDPLIHPHLEEIGPLLNWVKDGGILVWGIGEDDQLLKHAGVKTIEVGDSQVIISNFLNSPIYRNVNFSYPIYQDVNKIKIKGERRFKLDDKIKLDRKIKLNKNSKIILKDDLGAVILEIPYSDGYIYLVATPLFFSNDSLKMEDNAVFAARLMEYAAGTPGAGSRAVWFDEYHNGWESSRSFFMLFPSWIKVVLIQLLLGLLLYFIYLGKRFGSPFPLPSMPRRSILEYVTSAANLYRKAQARNSAFSLIYLGFKRRICQYLGANMEISICQLVLLLKTRKEFKEKELELFLKKCERALETKLTENELFSLTKEIEKWKRLLIKR